MKGDFNMKRTYKFVRDIIKDAEDFMVITITITSQCMCSIVSGHWYNDCIVDCESRVVLSQWYDADRGVWHVLI